MEEASMNEMKRTVKEQSDLIDRQAKMIYELQNVVNEIIHEIKKMQTTIPTKNPAERQGVLKTEEKKEHPRSGGVNPADVAIEKFFYAGNSR